MAPRLKPVGARRAFARGCQALVPEGAAYARYHEARLWATWRIAEQLLGQRGRGRFVSLGAGFAHVEAALVAAGHAGVVVDLQADQPAHRAHYAALGLEAVALDVASVDDLAGALGGDFDLALSCEIVEHLTTPPVAHFTALAKLLRRDGDAVVTTPNAGSFRRVVKTLLHIPVLPPAEATFGPVDAAHEGVHRREYMRREVVDALERAGLRPTSVRYRANGYSRAVDRLAVPFELAVAPLRDVLLVTATNL